MTLTYRSLLFAPGHDASRLHAAFASEADAVVADLEDSVPAADKSRARDLVADVLAGPTGTAARLIRINSPDSGPDERDVEALALGANDLAADLGLEATPGAQELLYARSKLVIDSIAAGLRGPFDRVYPLLDDPSGLEADAAFARALGFRGKSALHPGHVGLINGVFSALPEPAARDAIYRS